MKIRAHEAELLVVGTEEEQTAEITRIMLHAPQVSMVLATVLSASREAVRSHRTSTHDGRVAVDLLAPRSHRRYHVVSSELYTERGSVPRRTGAIKPRSPSS